MAEISAFPDKLRPNADAMYDALSFWFKLCTEGQLEIGWRDPQTKTLNRFKRFELDEIEELVAFAADINQQPGANVYFRVCTLRDMPGPTTDDHFLQAPGAHIDHDDAASVSRLRSHPLEFKPAYLVITGRDPEVRGQTFWPVAEPITDPAIVREMNSRLAQHFGGDPAVVNPTRLMRVPGSIAWPVKKGRTQTEITQLLWPAEQRLQRVEADALLTMLRQIGTPDQPELSQQAIVNSGTSREVATDTPKIAPQNPETHPQNADQWAPPVRQNAPVSQLIDATKQDGTWHNSVLRLVASWINRGLSDKEIHLFAPALTRPGYTVRQTHEEIQKMIEGARQKWNLPDRDPFADAAPPAEKQGIWTDDSDDLDDIPERPWLAPGILLRGAVTLLSGQGAGGKSSFIVAFTTSMAAGVQFGKITPKHKFRSINFNVEDDKDEQRRRYAAFLAASSHIDRSAIRSVIRVGPEGVGTLFQRDPDTGVVTPTQAMEDLKKLVIENDIDCVIFDPMAELHNAEENDNTAMRSILAAFRGFAKETNAGVMVLHHDRKGVGVAGDVDRMRGASALQGAARIVLTLTRMTEEEADALGIPQEERSSYIRIDNAKANYTKLGEAMWYKLTSQTISNGESIGACLPWTPPDRIASLTGEMKVEILRLMLEAGPAKCRAHHHSNDYAPRWLGEIIGADEKLVKQYLDACIKGGAVKIDKLVPEGDNRHPRPAYVVDRTKFMEMQQPSRSIDPEDEGF
jgi:hypothetical protein